MFLMQVKNITLYFMQMYKKAINEGHNGINPNDPQ